MELQRLVKEIEEKTEELEEERRRLEALKGELGTSQSKMGMLERELEATKRYETSNALRYRVCRVWICILWIRKKVHHMYVAIVFRLLSSYHSHLDQARFDLHASRETDHSPGIGMWN